MRRIPFKTRLKIVLEIHSGPECALSTSPGCPGVTGLPAHQVVELAKAAGSGFVGKESSEEIAARISLTGRKETAQINVRVQKVVYSGIFSPSLRGLHIKV